VVAAWCTIRLNDYHASLNAAELFIRQDRPQEAIKILEDMQKDYRLAGSGLDVLYDAYVRYAKKLIQAHRLKEAKDVLQRVPPRSVSGKDAEELLRRLRRH
jgi:hypothetical protein